MASSPAPGASSARSSGFEDDVASAVRAGMAWHAPSYATGSSDDSSDSDDSDSSCGSDSSSGSSCSDHDFAAEYAA